MGLQIAPAEEGFQIILGMARSGHVVRNNDNPGGGAPEACSEISRLRSSKPVQPLCLPTFSFENLCAPEIYKGRRCLHSRSATLHSPCFLSPQPLSSILSTMLARIKTSSSNVPASASGRQAPAFGLSQPGQAEPCWGPETAFGPAWYSTKPRPSRKAPAFTGAKPVFLGLATRV